MSTYVKLPLSFEPNQGQAGGTAGFMARGQGYSLLLNPSATTLALHRARPGHGRDRMDPGAALSGAPPAMLQLRLLGAKASAAAEPEDLLPGKSNYFIGNDRSQWRTDVPNYGRVRYRGVYPGIDVVYYGNQRLLEHDFEVAPGADPRKIRLQVDGAKRVEIATSGDLVLRLADGEVRLQKPVIYQRTAEGKREVAGGFVLRNKNEVGIRVGDYDRSQTLVIDPVLGYSTYLGGNGEDFASALAVDSTGNVYLVGYTASTNFPTTAGAFSTVCQNCSGPTDDVFVTKVNPSGTTLVYSTFISGSNDDEGYSIAVDGSGNAYLTGFTNSSNFPVTAGAYQTTLKSFLGNAFVSVLNASGNGLVYSTYLGGSARDFGNPIALDASGNIYVGGISYSTDFPTVGTPISSPPPTWYVSTNGATSFSASSTGIKSLQVFDTVVDKGTAGTLYVGTVGGGVYKSTTSGAAWTQMPTPFPVALNPAQLGGDFVNVLIMDKNTTGGAAILYAGSQFFGVSRTTTGGASWGLINSGLGAFTILSLALNPLNTATLYAGTSGNGVWVTNNANAATPTWSQMPQTGLTNTTVTALAVDPVNGTLYAGTNAGVFSFSAVTNSWAALTNGIPAGLTIHQLAVDGSSNVYAATSSAGGVYKFNPGTATWTKIGGSGATAITTGEVFGVTVDPNVPTTLYAATQPGVYKSTDGGASWTLHTTGPGLVTTNGSRVAVDPNSSANVYFSGFNPLSFVAKFPAGGGAPVMLTQFGGLSGQTYITSMAADSLGNAYVAGTANTPLPPPLVGPQTTIVNPPNYDAFVSKISAGQTVSYSRLLGGSSFQEVVGLAVDSSFNAYAAGLTYSMDFVTTANAFQTTHDPAPSGDAFVLELDPTGANLLYSSLFGGSGDDQGFNLALLSPGIVGIVGTTSSTDLPTVNAVQPLRTGSYDAFYAKFDLTKSGAASLLYATYLGGAGFDAATGVGFDALGNTYIGGYTTSGNFPVTGGVVQGTFSGAGPDAFLAKLQSTGNSSDVSITIPSTTGPTVAEGQAWSYTIVATNSGPSTGGAPSVVVAGVVPASLSINAATVTAVSGGATIVPCPLGTQSFSCNFGNLPIGATATIQVNVTANTLATPPAVTSTVSVRISTADDDPVLTNNVASASVTVQRQADLFIAILTTSTTALNGVPLTYNVGVSNNGPNNATGVVVSYPLPAGVAFVSSTPAGLCAAAGGTVTCNLGALAVATPTSFGVTVTPSLLGTLSSTFTVSSPQVVDNVPGNNSATFNTTINANVDLSITAPGALTAAVGGSAGIGLTMHNAGVDTATSVSATISLAAGMSYVTFSSPTSGVTCSVSVQVTCSLPNLAPNASLSVTIYATAVLQGAHTVNASVSFSGTDVNPANNTAFTVVTFTGGLNSTLTTVLTDYEANSLQMASGYPTPSTIGAPIPAGASPSNVVLAPNGRLGFVADINATYIAVIDLTIGAEITRIRNLRAWSLAITSDGTKLVSVGYNADELDIIDIATITSNPAGAVTRISLDNKFGDVAGVADIHPFSLGLVGNVAYIANEFGPVIWVDFTNPGAPLFGTVTGTAAFAQLHAGHQVAATPDGSTVVVYGRPKAGGASLAYLISSATKTLSKTVTATFGNATTITIQPNPNAATGVVGFLGHGGRIVVLDLRVGSPTYGTILSTGVLLAATIQDIAVTPDGATVQAIQGVAQGSSGPSSMLYTLDANLLVTNPAGAVLSSVPIFSSISMRGIAIGYVATAPLAGAPQVFDVQPSEITNEAPKTVTIFGDNFASGALVRIGNLEPLPATFVSRQQITVTVPAGAAVQVGDIVVTLPNATAGALGANLSGGGMSGFGFARLRISPPATFAPAHPAVVASYGSGLSLLFRDSVFLPGAAFSPGLAIAPDGLYAYSGIFELGVTNLDLALIQLLASGPNGAFANCTTAGNDGYAVAPDPVTGKKVLYLVTCDPTNFVSDTLYIVDVDPSSTTTRNTVLGTIQAAPTDFFESQSIAATPDGRYVFAPDLFGTGTTTRLVIFDVLGNTSTIIPDITALGADFNQVHIQVTPDGKSLLLSGTGNTSIKVYDISGTVVPGSSPTNPLLAATISGSGAPTINPPLYYWFQVAGTTSPRLFAYASDQRYVQAFDFNTRTPLGSYTIPSVPGRFAGTAMAVTPEGSLIYAALDNEDTVAVLDANLVAASSPNSLITKMRTVINASNVAISPRSNATADLFTTIHTSAPSQVEGGPGIIGLNQPFGLFMEAVSNGPSTGTGVTMTLGIPAGITVTGAVISNSSGGFNFTCSVSATQVVCPVGALGVNDYVAVSVTVSATALGSYTLTSTVAGNELDPVPSNNSASVQVNVVTGTDLAVTVMASPSPAPLDQTVTIVETITNTGPAVATAVSASLFFNYSTTPVWIPSQGTCSSFGTCALGDLAPGASATITTSTAASGFAAFFGPGLTTAQITGSASSTTPDPDATNNYFTLALPLTNPSQSLPRWMVADRYTGQIYLFDSATNVSFGQNTDSGVSPNGIAISPNGHIAFVANLNATYVSVVDLSMQQEIYRVRFGDASVRNVAVTPDGARVVATLGSAPKVVIIDAVTFQVVKTLDLSAQFSDSPGCVSLGPAVTGHQAYVGCSASANIAVVDTNSFAVSTVTGVSGAPTLFSGNSVFAATPDGLYVVTVRAASTIQIISTASNSVVQTVTDPSIAINAKIAIGMRTSAPLGTYGYFGSNPINVLDLTSGAPTFGQIVPGKSVSLGFAAQDLAVSPDGTRLYAISQNNIGNNVAAVDTGTLVSAGGNSSIVFEMRNGGPCINSNTCPAALHAVAAGLVDTLPIAGAPVITGVTPDLVFNNTATVITITGTGFASDARVRVGKLDGLPVTFVSSNELQVTLPAGAPAHGGDIIVTNPNATAALRGQLLSGFLKRGSDNGGLEILSPISYQPRFQAVASDFGAGTIHFLSQSGGGDTRVIVGTDPMGIAFSPDGSEFYVEAFSLASVIAGLPDCCRNGQPPQHTQITLSGLPGQLLGIAVAPNPATSEPVALVTSRRNQSGSGPSAIPGDVQLNVIDVNPSSPSMNSVLFTIPAQAGSAQTPGGLGVTTDGRYVYQNLATDATTPLVVFDTLNRTATLIPNTGLSIGTFQPTIVVTPDNQSLLLGGVSGNLGTIKVFDISTDKLLQTPTLVHTIVPTTPCPTGVSLDVFTLVGNHLYAYDVSQRVVEIFNFNRATSSYACVNYFNVPGSAAVPSGFVATLGVTPDESLIYAPAREDDAVAVIDAAKLISGGVLGDPSALVTTIATAAGPSAVAISPKRLDAAVMDVGIAISHAPSPVQLGSDVTFNVTLTNYGPFTGGSLQGNDSGGFVINFDPALAPISSTFFSSPSVNCNLIGTQLVCGFANHGPDLGPVPQTISGSIVFQATTVGTFAVTGGIVNPSGTYDPNLANNTASDAAAVVAADLALGMTASPASVVAPGSNLTYTITVLNNGPSASTGFTVTDTLAAGATLVSGSSSTGCSGTTVVTCTGPALAVGQSATFIIVVTPTAVATLTNTASVTGNEVDPVLTNNAATVTNTAVAADISVSAGGSPTPIGGLPAFLATVKNNGPSDATGVLLTDVLDNFGFVSATSTQGTCSFTAPTVTCSLGSLVNGASAVVTVVTNPPKQGWAANIFKAIAIQPDPILTNNAVRLGPAPDSFNTPAGANVGVVTTDTADGLVAAVTFSSVTRTGSTTMSPLAAASLPPGFRTGRQPTFFDISTNAEFTGAIGMTIQFVPSNFRHPALVRLFHYEAGAWVDRTISVDSSAGAIAGRVLSLSPFALLEPLDTIPVANAGTDRVVPGNMAAGSLVTLDGAASFDADGDPLSYRWSGPFPEGGGVVTGVRPSVTLPLGVSRVWLVVNDGEADSPAVSVNIGVADFQLSAPTGAVALSRGQSATFAITSTPLYGAFGAPVNLGCSSSSPSVTCSFSTASITPGASGATATLTVTTAAAVARAPSRSTLHQLALWLGALPLVGLIFIGAGRRRRVQMVLLLVVLVLAAAYVGCGGGGATQTQSSSGAPVAKAVTVTVTGISGTLQHSSSVTVTIPQ